MARKKGGKSPLAKALIKGPVAAPSGIIGGVPSAMPMRKPGLSRNSTGGMLKRGKM